MPSAAKHLTLNCHAERSEASGLSMGFWPVASARFFPGAPGLRMTSYVYSCQSYTYVKPSQVE